MFDREYFEKNEFVKKIYSFENLQCIEDQNDVMHICFNIDINFFRPTGVTITSILENNSNMKFAFHIFTDAVSKKDLEALEKTTVKYKQSCYVYLMDMAPFANFHIKHPRFKKVSYFRLYMPKVLKKITRYFIYIDADLICINSMEAFKKIDLEGKVLAAVSDLPEAVKTRSDFLGLKSGKYFNSGVLWIDTEKWEENSITEKAFSYQGRDPKSFTCHDQDVLNLVMDGDIKFIDEKFNHLGCDGRKVPERCIIYHFFGREKPWNLALTEYDKMWRRYLDISFWDSVDDPLPERKPENYHNFKQAGKFFRKHHNWQNALKCYLWYAILKVRLKIKS